MNYKSAEPAGTNMSETQEPGRSRLARVLLGGALAAVAVRSFRRGKRVSGALAGAGAAVLGYSAVRGAGESDARDHEPIDIGADEDTDASTGGGADSGSGESASGVTARTQLQCAICGEPITPGQAREPGPDDETVHTACEETLH